MSAFDAVCVRGAANGAGGGICAKARWCSRLIGPAFGIVAEVTEVAARSCGGVAGACSGRIGAVFSHLKVVGGAAHLTGGPGSTVQIFAQICAPRLTGVKVSADLSFGAVGVGFALVNTHLAVVTAGVALLAVGVSGAGGLFCGLAAAMSS